MVDHVRYVESLDPLATSDHSLLRRNLLTSVREVESGANRSLNLPWAWTTDVGISSIINQS